MGRREDALAAGREAADAYRELAAARPDAFRPDLAGSLNNLSLRLADLGRREDALAAIQEGAQVYRELAAARPDAFRPGLARSLTNLAAAPERHGAARGGAGRKPRNRQQSAGSWPRPARTRSGPTWRRR